MRWYLWPIFMSFFGCNAQETSSSVVRSGPPDVILISMDGVRLDRTHFGGNGNQTTPSLDAILDESLWFPNAWAQSNESLYSHASLFTGRYVSEIARPEYRSFVLPDAWSSTGEINTIAELMVVAGYQSAAFMGGGHISAEFGTAQGFDPFVEGGDFASFQSVLQPSIDWMETQSNDTPLFMFLHGYDAHRPYGHASVFHLPFDSDYQGEMLELVNYRNATELIYRGVFYDVDRVKIRHTTGKQMSDPTATYALLEQQGRDVSSGRVLTQEDLNHMAARYDSGVLSADTYVGLFIDFLKSSGRWDQTLLIITSDHGEDLQTHGFSNHRAVLFDTTTRVPFILSGGALPESLRGTQNEALVAAVDLMPTLADMLQIEAPSGSHGRSLWPLFESAPIDEKTYLFQQGVVGQTSVRTHTHRLNFYPPNVELVDETYFEQMEERPILDGSFSLYDLSTDPMEQIDILAQNPHLGMELRTALVAWSKSLSSGTATHTPSPEASQSMQRQGYWDASEPASD